MKPLKYICEYLIPFENDENRSYTVSANRKIDYIVSVLNRNGYCVELVSPSKTNQNCFYAERIDAIDDKNTVISGKTIPAKYKLFSQLYSQFWLMQYLIKNCTKDEIVIVYHGKLKIPFILLAQKVKKFKIVLELEELYSDLGKRCFKTWCIRLMEKAMIRKASGFILASKQLGHNLNKDNKPSVVACGNYTVAKNIEPNMYLSTFTNDKIHLVYAGLIKKNNGAFRCAALSSYLPNNYHVHIIGYGTELDIQFLQQTLAEGSRNATCVVTYDGFKNDDDYSAFLQACDIGLCPLDSDERYQKACFPSKITSYLSNGLTVITTYNEVIASSSYGDVIVFALSEQPRDFAKAILSVKPSDLVDARDEINSLDREFGVDMNELIKRLRGEKNVR